MLLFPNAKINIGLNITGKRSDGFHNLKSLLFPIGFSDILEVNISGEKHGYNFTQTGIKLDIPEEDNLCIRALNLLLEYYDLPGINIHLHKIIPTGSGLGGGSSDSVSVMKALDKLFSIGISDEKMHEYSSRLGSDCPFFVNNQPAIIKGRGDVQESIDLSLSGYFLLLIVPDISVNTAYAYSLIKPCDLGVSLKEKIKQSVIDWKANIINDFELELFKVFPGIGEIKDELYDMGAVYASMSGSGSSVYGIFENKVVPREKFKKCLVYSQDL